MSDWKEYKLGELLEINRGGSPRPISKYVTDDPNGINWIKIGDAKESSKYITETKEKIKPEGISKSRLVEEGDFILSNSMSYGRPYIMKTRGCIHDGWLLLRKNGCKDIYNEYLYYVLGSYHVYKQFNKLASGTTVKNLNISLVSKVTIPLPPLQKQKEIVDKLDRAQRLIDIDQIMLDKYDEMIQSVFLEMFGDPVSNPKGWEVKNFENIAEIDKHSFDPTNFDGTVNYVGLKNIEKESGNLVEVEKITEGDLKSRKYKFTPQHILYGKLRPYLNKVAFPDSEGVCSTDIIPIKPLDGVATKYFVGYLLKSKSFVKYADKNSSGANLPRINLKKIRNFKSFLPPFKLQREFDDLVTKISIEKKKTSISLRQSQKLFDSLVQKNFDNE